MRFQTRLMLAVLLAVALVTGMVIAQTEKKVREMYSRLAEEQFDEQAERFLEMRRSRLEVVAGSVERLADSPEVKRVFQNGDFSAEGLAEVEAVSVRMRRGGPAKDRGQISQGEGGRDGSDEGEVKRLIALVDRDSNAFMIGEVPFEIPEATRVPFRQMNLAGQFATRQVGYIVLAEPDRDLVELVVAPVTAPSTQSAGDEDASDADSKTGEWLGTVVMGHIVNPSTTERRSAPTSEAGGNPQRRVQAQIPMILAGARRRLFSGVYAEGVLFAGSLPATAVGQVESLIAEELSGTARPATFEKSLTVESLEIGKGSEQEELHYRLFCSQLNPGGVLPPAYQVVLISMSQLHADLRDLRLRGTGIGGGAALFGLILAWFFSRRLAKPIQDLVGATQELRRGNFQMRVPVRSRDEFGELAASFNDMAGELETKEQIRDMLGKVSDEAVAQALIEGRLELGGEMREVSVLFCDIRGFTAMTEDMSPADVIGLLNDHMSAMTEVVYEHRGVIDKFVGDEIMVIFGAPKSYGDDAGNAARCALEMIKRRVELNAKPNEPLVEVGVGVATGDVIVGCMGSTDRLNYTVIGERVNRAARLCSCAGPGEVVIDDLTWDRLGESASGAERLRFKPKGYKKSVRAFRLDAVGAAEKEPVEDSDANAGSPITSG